MRFLGVWKYPVPGTLNDCMGMSRTLKDLETFVSKKSARQVLLNLSHSHASIVHDFFPKNHPAVNDDLPPNGMAHGQVASESVR